MPGKLYVLPEEQDRIREEAAKQAVIGVEGPVSFYESWPDEEPKLTITKHSLEAYRPYCQLFQQDEDLWKQCIDDHVNRATNCVGPERNICWAGVSSAATIVKDEFGHSVTLMGGAFLVDKNRGEEIRNREKFLHVISSDKQDEFRKKWDELPEVDNIETVNQKCRELESIGRNYLGALKRHSDFRYSADLLTHDVVIALQALIANIEVLNIDLKDTFGIGKKWDRRFEDLIKICEDHNSHLELLLIDASIDFDQIEFVNDSLSRLIYECAEPFIPIANNRHIEWKIDLEQIYDEHGKHEVLDVRMGRNALKKAFINIFDNAVKYSFNGSPDHPRWIEINGHVVTKNDQPGYQVVVKNLGIGIEENEIDLVFKPGYRGRRRVSEARSGHGIGLTFVKKCIERHGGDITIRSRPERRTGWLTEITIWLPLSEVEKISDRRN